MCHTYNEHIKKDSEYNTRIALALNEKIRKRSKKLLSMNDAKYLELVEEQREKMKQASAQVVMAFIEQYETYQVENNLEKSDSLETFKLYLRSI